MYVCMYECKNDQFIFDRLILNTNSTIINVEQMFGKSLELQCNSSILVSIYAKIRIHQ